MSQQANKKSFAKVINALLSFVLQIKSKLWDRHLETAERRSERLRLAFAEWNIPVQWAL